MSIFKFKQFDVDQSGCAMKINTDGVLLAAMVGDIQPKRILDIGTGTGVLALMMAQRFPDAKIDAVEIDEQASRTANKNFQSSSFKHRLNVAHIAIENYNNAAQFDLIISNPPYFINDLKNQEEKKGIARHATDHFFSDLVEKVNTILSPKGEFWFILPVKQSNLLIEKAKRLNFNVNELIYLHSDKNKEAFRYIVALTKKECETSIKHFYIYESEKVYTDCYKELLKPFFLNY
jgi:tRNA1Val (adenine37-N6)-methyltransferase